MSKTYVSFTYIFCWYISNILIVEENFFLTTCMYVFSTSSVKLLTKNNFVIKILFFSLLMTQGLHLKPPFEILHCYTSLE